VISIKQHFDLVVIREARIANQFTRIDPRRLIIKCTDPNVEILAVVEYAHFRSFRRRRAFVRPFLTKIGSGVRSGPSRFVQQAINFDRIADSQCLNAVRFIFN
jgi:hypothetical protein